MATKHIGIIVNGATGRIASTQHLANALIPIRTEGGLTAGADRIVPRLLLVARDARRLGEIARTHGAEDWTTDLDEALGNRDFTVFFDAAATVQRVSALNRAISAGKHIYSEKPIAPSVAEGLVLLRAARSRGLKHGAVEDKIFLPGLQKLGALARQGFFGRITGFALEFGWWVFDGAERPGQRPSWNYRRDGGGGLTSDMYPHWRYIIESILGPIDRVTAATATAVAERVDELGQRYRVDVDDTSITLVGLTNGVVGTIRCSWATRVRRDDLLTLQIDGTGGSAVAGLHRCWMQSTTDAPAIHHINPTIDVAEDYRATWNEVPACEIYVNPYRMGWESFIRHVVTGAPMLSDLYAGLRDVQLAEACYRSATEKKWVELCAIVD